MKRYQRYLLSAFVMLLCLFILVGCFDRRELDTLGIVMGVAIDKAPTEGDTEVTVMVVNVSAGQSSKSKGKSSMGGESSTSSSAFTNISSTGKNMNYIIREMQHKMSRRIYVAHSEVIVFGEDLAKNGVRDCLDFFARAPEARMTLYVFVAKGNAKAVFDINPEFEKLPSTELVKILEDQKITAHAPIVTEFEFVSAMISKTTSAVAPIIRITDEGGRKDLTVEGCAVFKESRMVGEFDAVQTRGLLLVKSQVKTGVMELNIMDTTATVEIRQSKAKVTPVIFSDGKAQFNVEVNATIGLGDQSGSVNLSDPDNVPAMISAAETAMKGEIQSAVDKSKELDADVFGFGEYINRKYPDQWKEMKSKWDELYKNIEVNITVKAKADGSGRLVKPLAPEGE